eukprot:TRINITY_DN1437_c0_g1_i6.p1 TRINITY_DN1437_c0_g1~~TRINITY_DN1437_c0_g1_i6.p1  ORF type:complete len:105 (-),score=15.58 TRINITY_DN1437_c0_g1_i6:103-417(-)
MYFCQFKSSTEQNQLKMNLFWNWRHHVVNDILENILDRSLDQRNDPALDSVSNGTNQLTQDPVQRSQSTDADINVPNICDFKPGQLQSRALPMYSALIPLLTLR